MSLFCVRNLALAALMAGALPPLASAQTMDPAAQTVDALDAGLIATMKTPGPIAARTRVIAPVVERAFDLGLMARLSVGPAWTSFAPADQQALLAAFRAFTISQYARNFVGYSGEHFLMVGAPETRGADKLVRTALVSPGGQAEALNYRLRAAGGQWKIIDVYYRNSISQLATRRSDFAGVLAKGGAKALIAHLEALASAK